MRLFIIALLFTCFSYGQTIINSYRYGGVSLGSELLTNPDSFSSGWSYQNGSSATAGEATAIGAGQLISSAANHVVYQDITALTNGVQYRMEIRWKRTSGTGDAYIGIKFSNQKTVSGLSSSYVTQSWDITAGATGQDRFTFGAASGTTVVVDWVSLKQIL